MTPARRFGLPALLAALLLPLAGCFNGAVNPSYFPHWFGQASLERTHAKPGGEGYYSNFDPKSVRLEVRPLKSTNPVRTQQLVIATVLDEKGNARRKRRVEWMLEGVGTIVEVDESGYLAGRGYKVDNKYAVSYTDLFEHTLSRGNGDATGDFVIHPGQSWCVISSPIEGETRLTVYAPEIFDWERRTVTANLYWADCQWQFPAPTSARSGSPHTLTTHLFRHSDRAPVPGLRVRYVLKDGGPQAELLPNRMREVVVPSDQNGDASVAIQQLNLQPGVNRIGIEIIRPPSDSAGAPVLLASEETTVDWQAPQIQLNFNAPASAALNQEIPATVTITNGGQVDTQSGLVYVQVPRGLQVVRSDPPARQDRDYLVWDLASLGGGRQQTVNLTFRAQQKGSFPARVVAQTRDSLKAEQSATIRIEQGRLKVAIIGDARGVVGVPVDCEIQVTNPSAAEVSGVILDMWLDNDLVAIAPNGARFERKVQNDRIPPLKPGESRTLPIKLDAARAGRFTVKAQVVADGGLSAESAAAVEFAAPEVKVERSGPITTYVGRDTNWSLRVSNDGGAPVSGAVLRNRIPAELMFRSATDGGVFDARTGEVVWNLGNLRSREERIVKVTAYASRPGTQVASPARLTGQPNVSVDSGSVIDVLGVPALRVDVRGDVSPVDVGGRVTYTIQVTNQGTLPLDQVDISATVPSLMRALGGRGMQQVAPRGNVVTFPAINNLPPNQTATLYVFAQAVEGGDARLRVAVQTPSLAQPIVTEEATQILKPLGRR